MVLTPHERPDGADEVYQASLHSNILSCSISLLIILLGIWLAEALVYRLCLCGSPADCQKAAGRRVRRKSGKQGVRGCIIPERTSCKKPVFAEHSQSIRQEKKNIEETSEHRAQA